MAGVSRYDLSTPAGLALLRRFDAAFHRCPVASRALLLEGLELVLPLAARGEGLLVLPGGALAWREGERLRVADPASCVGVTTSAASLWSRLTQHSRQFFIRDARNGLQVDQNPTFSGDFAVLVPDASLFADILPAVVEWRGPALIHGHPGGAAIWEMVPAPPALALAASLVGEPLEEGTTLPRFLWAMEGSDECYQHLSAALSAHLDEWLAPEVSDALRFAIIGRWTDGAESVASALADAISLLPRAFAAEEAAAKAPWRTGVAEDACLLGLAAQDGTGWDAALRRRFLEAARALGGAHGHLLSASPIAPAALGTLAADRLAKAECRALALCMPAPDAESPIRLLREARALAGLLEWPVTLAVPCWGLVQVADGAGRIIAGNATAFGLGAGLESLESE